MLAAFHEWCKQYIFPKMSRDVCCLAKAYNKNQKRESGIRLGDNGDTLSVRVCAMTCGTLRFKANLNIKHFPPSQLKQKPLPATCLMPLCVCVCVHVCALSFIISQLNKHFSSSTVICTCKQSNTLLNNCKGCMSSY